MALKAMNCPGHMLVFASENRSYRDLPIRFHEQTALHRNEASGVLGGLTRVRQFSQDDAHCFVMEAQIGDEVAAAAAAWSQQVYGDLGLELQVKLSTRPEKYLGELETWDHAEAQLQAGARGGRPGLHAQRGRRRVLRPEDRLRRHRRDRPQVAVCDDPARLPAAGALRPEVHRRRQRRAPAGGHPPGDLRQLRALHRAADRALRRGVPALAGAGAGDRPADCRPPRAYAAQGRRRWRPAGCGSALDERLEKIGTRFAKPSCRRCRTCWWSATRKSPRDGVVASRRRLGSGGGVRRTRGRSRARPGGRRIRAFPAGMRTAQRGAFKEVVIAFDNACGVPDGTTGSGSTSASACARSGSSTRPAQQLGIMAPAQDALRIARSKGLDLVEVAATAVPPVCRITDYGKYQYNEQKRPGRPASTRRPSRSRKSSSGPKVDLHDYDFKKSNIERFLHEGDKVKATVFFRGREIAHPEIGRRILERLIAELNEIARRREHAADRGQHDAHHPRRRSRSRRSSGGERPPAAAGAAAGARRREHARRERHGERPRRAGRGAAPTRRSRTTRSRRRRTE